MVTVSVKKLTDTAVLPKRGSEEAAGYDLYIDSAEEVVVKPGETIKAGTGIAMAIPDGYFGGIYARSGLATKQGLRPANCVGVVDSDYRGEIIVALHNDTDKEQTLVPYERIAQIIIQPYLSVEFETVDELGTTVRGASGFGASGKQ